MRHPGFFNRIEPGDEICFWLAKTGLLSRVRSTTSLYALDPTSAPAHWVDAHDGEYTHRFEFETVSESLVKPTTWKEIQQRHGRNYAAQAPAIEIADSEAEAHLRSLFSVQSDSAFDDLSNFEEGEHDPPHTNYEKGEDLRTRAHREITVRRGQKKFRKALFAAYRNRCAVTGSSVYFVLEAAHIDRYFGDHSNHVTNGLLLRADLHTLFDLQL